MIPELEYVRPNELSEVLALIDENEQAKIIAGGTDIIPGLRQGAFRFKKAKLLVDIHALPELKTIREENGRITIGAALTFSELIAHPLVEQNLPILFRAASGLGSVQIRNRATIAGNFVNNAPCADSVPALLVYDAVLTIQSLQQKREILLSDFLIKPYQTQLKANEIVTEIKLPILAKNYVGDFYKLGRRKGQAISRITLALLMKIKAGIIHELRVASGAVSPIGLRFKEVENSARGKKISNELYQELAQRIGKKILDITKLRWSSAYKIPVLQQMMYQLFQRVHPI